MQTDLQDIEEALQTYFDGMYEGDTDKLGGVFHEVAHLFGVADGKLTDWSREYWFDLVRNRKSPKSQDLAAARLGGSDRPFRSGHGVRQGALPDPAAVFHRLPDIRETG